MEDYEQKSAQQVFFQRERTSRLDWLIAGILALGSFSLAALFRFPSLSPEVWTDAAVAAELRPPLHVMSGLWRAVSSWGYAPGVAMGNLLLAWAGRLELAAIAACSYLLFRSILTLCVRARLRDSQARDAVQRLACGVGAVLFTVADPVWRLGQAWSPDGLLLLMVLVLGVLFTRYLLDGQQWKLYVVALLLGGLIAETPLGVFLLGLCWLVLLLTLRNGSTCDDLPLINPMVAQSAKWRLSIVGGLAFVAMMAVDVGSFVSMQGLAASGHTRAELPLLVALHWWQQVVGAASGLGWLLGAGACLLPLVVIAVMLPQGVDEEHLLPYRLGVTTFFTGTFALLQLAQFSTFWFWRWHEDAAINSPLLLAVFLLIVALAVVFALVILGCDLACRNHRRILLQCFAELGEPENGVQLPKDAEGRPWGRFALVAVAALIVGGVVPGRRLGAVRDMLTMIDDYVREVCTECGNVRWLFTDGTSDSAYAARFELASSERGGKLVVHSMMAGNTAYDRYLRLRGMEDLEDRMSLELGASTALWSWVRDKPARQADFATQLGFEMWKKVGRELPPCSGVVSRPTGMTSEECEAGIARSSRLSNRILAFYADRDGELPREAGVRISSLFNFMQWRLARLARMRAERADRAGELARARQDVEISDALDGKNAALKRIRDDMVRTQEASLRQVSPREGLQLALVRADFARARQYAELILPQDEHDPSANFAMAMSYYTQKQWNRAEAYFRNCLNAKPREAAAWNNLALTYLELKRFDEARDCAKRALELLPDSPDVKDTVKTVESAIQFSNKPTRSK